MEAMNDMQALSAKTSKQSDNSEEAVIPKLADDDLCQGKLAEKIRAENSRSHSRNLSSQKVS